MNASELERKFISQEEMNDRMWKIIDCFKYSATVVTPYFFLCRKCRAASVDFFVKTNPWDQYPKDSRIRSTEMAEVFTFVFFHIDHDALQMICSINIYQSNAAYITEREIITPFELSHIEDKNNEI